MYFIFDLNLISTFHTFLGEKRLNYVQYQYLVMLIIFYQPNVQMHIVFKCTVTILLQTLALG